MSDIRARNDEVERLYQSGLTQEAVGREVGMTREGIAKVMRKLSVPGRTRSEVWTIRNAKRRYILKPSAPESARVVVEFMNRGGTFGKAKAAIGMTRGQVAGHLSRWAERVETNPEAA